MTTEILRGMLEGKIRFPTARKALRELRNRAREQSRGELDLSTGSFWETPLGEAVREFAVAHLDSKNTLSFSTRNAAEALGLYYAYWASSAVSKLASSLLLAKVEYRSRRYHLSREDVLLCGLAFLHLQRGYNLDEAYKNLNRLLKGTSLISRLGQPAPIYIATPIDLRRVFAEDSPWRAFPLDAPAPQVKPARQLTSAREEERREEIDEELGDPLEAVEVPIDKPKRKAPFVEKIPQMERMDLAELEKWDAGSLKTLHGTLPPSKEVIDFSGRPGFFSVAKAILFIHRVNDHVIHQSSIESFDPTLKNLEYVDLRNAIPTPFGYITDQRRNLPNLRVVFERMEHKVREWEGRQK